MPAVWELTCPKRVRSRRALFQDGVKALRRDAGVRRVDCSKTSALLFARVTFWNEGPVDEALAHLREEFGPANVNRPAPRPLRYGDIPRVALDLESQHISSTRNALDVSMGCMVSAAERLRPAMESIVHMGMRAGRSIVALNDATRELILQNYLASEEGRPRLAAAMAAPIRAMRDFASLSRRLLPVEQMPVPPGTIYMASEPEFVGQMPVRTELTVLGADEVNQAALGPRLRRERTEGLFEIERGPLQPYPEMPLSRIFYMDYQYGGRPSITIPKPAPVPVPAWCVPGTWLYDQSTGRFALVRAVIDKGTSARVKHWRKGHLRNSSIVEGLALHLHWNPCDGPKMPRESWWEDLLRDDFANL